jgi:hypothetical protein
MDYVVRNIMSARKLQIINRPDRSCHDTPSIPCCIDPCRLTMVNTPAARVLPPPVLFFSILHARRVRGSQRRCTARRPSRRGLGLGSGLRRISLHGHWGRSVVASTPRLALARRSPALVRRRLEGDRHRRLLRRPDGGDRPAPSGAGRSLPQRRSRPPRSARAVRPDRDQAWRWAPSRSARAPVVCPGGRRPGRAAGITIRERRGAGCRRPAAAGSRASSGRRS